MHAKAMIIDDTMAIVGTANLDARSLRLNYETNLVAYDDHFVNRLKEIVLSDFADSTEILPDEWKARPVAHRVAENTALLLTPIL
jgi:cardiolipin synthase